MDESRVREIVDRNLRGLRCVFCLGDWTINTEYGPIKGFKDRSEDGGEVAATCKVLHDYLIATIRIDPVLMKDTAMVVSTLQHEMTHILHSDLYLFRDQVYSQLPAAAVDAMEIAWKAGVEKLVGNIEKFVRDGLRIDPAGLAERGDRWLVRLGTPKPKRFKKSPPARRKKKR